MLPNEVIKKLNQYIELCGPEHVLDSLVAAMGTAELKDCLEHIDRHEELGLFEEEEEESNQ